MIIVRRIPMSRNNFSLQITLPPLRKKKGKLLTQCGMKANGEVEDHLMVWLLSPKECVNTTVHKEQACFLTSIYDHWGLGAMVKDLRPDVLNLVQPDTMEDEDPLSFP
jgi:hypothetical protein